MTQGDDVAELLERAGAGDRAALARLLTVVEQGGETAQALAATAYRQPPPYSVGLTGAPGAGKSTLTNRLIAAARAGWPAVEGADAAPIDQLAVIAVDPTSPFSGGAILGDRIRMQDHATDPSVFIRSMAARRHVGGLALAVPDAVRVLGAAGMPLVIVETVGVGQTEVEVASATDTTVVVVTPGWGDSMQANKAGLLEVADVLVVNKADRPGVREARRDLEQMLDLSAPSDWRPPVLEAVAADGGGVEELWASVAKHRAHLAGTGALETRRAQRLAAELKRVMVARLLEEVAEVSSGEGFAGAVEAMTDGRLDPYSASDLLLRAMRPPREQ